MFIVSEFMLSAFRGLIYGIIASIFIIFLSMIYRYFTNENFPSILGMILGLGIFEISGGLTAILYEPTIEGATEIIIASIVIGWGVHTGNKLAEKIPKKSIQFQNFLKQKYKHYTRINLPVQHLIFDISGKSRVPKEIKNDLSEREMLFPADLPPKEIEKRLRRRLITDWGVGEVEAEIDHNGKITHLAISAKEHGLSEGIPKGCAAVPLKCEMLPSGLALGDIVRIYLKNKKIIDAVEIKGVNRKEKQITVVLKQDDIETIHDQEASLIVVLPYKPNLDSILVKESSGAIKEFDVQRISSAVKNVGVDDESAKNIAGVVKSKLMKSAVPISTKKIEDTVVDELGKKSIKSAKKFKKRKKTHE
ncbi:MAG: hypothetical protein IAX21_10630 [Candidatus Bathyarchaeota archaeon]|nr:MAG: hypothetical protein IAX21_10630 [Candidatus Bathyarchaeota archaeon]